MSVFSGPLVSSNGLFLCMDASNTRSYPGSGTTWFDISGNGNHGTIINAPTHNGKTFTFSSASSQRVAVPYNPAWRLTGSNTFSFWSYDANTAGCIIGYQKGGWEGYNFNSNVLSYSGTAGSNDLNSSTSKSTNEWALVTVVIDRTAGNYYTYKNASLVATKAIVHPDLNSIFSTGELTIGGNGTITSRYYTGSIAFVSHHTRALSASEISKNYKALRGRFEI